MVLRIRKMPPSILAAYREPIDLLGLLRQAYGSGAGVYRRADLPEIRETMLRLLTERHGVAETKVGRGYQLVATRARSFRVDVIKAIEFLLDVPEYGGREETMSVLAEAMQPRWTTWWDSMGQVDGRDGSRDPDPMFYFAASRVFGHRQMRWIGAQLAKTCVGYLSEEERELAESVISAAEEYADRNDEDSMLTLSDEAGYFEASAYQGRVTGSRDYAKMVISMLGASFFSFDIGETLRRVRMCAGYAGGGWNSELADVGSSKALDLVRTVFSAPTLITGAMRSSGSSSGRASARSIAVPIVTGALLGAGAVHLAKRA